MLKIGTQAPIDLKKTQAKFHEILKYGSKDIMSLINWEGLLLHYYIYKLTSYKPDFRNSWNFTSVIFMSMGACVPIFRKIH